MTGWASPGKQTVSAANEREPGLGPRAWGGALAIAHPDSRRCRGGGRAELGPEMGSLRADKGSLRDSTLLTDGWTHRQTDSQRGSSQAPARPPHPPPAVAPQDLASSIISLSPP